MTFRHLISKNFKRNIRNYLLFFFSSILAFVSAFVFIYILGYFMVMGKSGYIGDNVIIIVFSMTVIICVLSVVFIDYALKNFIKLRAYDYSIMLCLGIQPKQMLYLVCTEYLSILMYVIILGGVFGQLIVGIGTFFLNKLNISVNEVELSSIKTFIMIMIVYITIIALGLFLFYRKYKKLGITESLNHMTQRDSYRSKEIWISLIGTFLGFTLLMLSMGLLLHYSVVKMIIAMFLHIISIYIIFLFGGRCIIFLIKKWKVKYYKYVLEWNNFITRFNQNKKILFIIYTVNFLCIFIVGGFISSFLSEPTDEKDKLYPYDVVCHLNSKNEESTRKLIQNLVKESKTVELSLVPINIKDNPAMGISCGMYNFLTGENEILAQNEIFYLEQRVPEEFKPLEEKAVDIIVDGKKYNYLIKDSDWNIIFGSQLNEQLNRIVVLQDIEYEKLIKQSMKESVILINYDDNQLRMKTEENIVRESIHDNKNIYFKAILTNARKASSSFLIVMIVVIGLLLVIESGCVIYIKLFCDMDTLKKEYAMLVHMGMKQKRMIKTIKGEFKVNYLFPILLSTVFAFIFFVSDCSYQVNNIVVPFLIFSVVTLVYLIGQLLFYLIVARKLVNSILGN